MKKYYLYIVLGILLIPITKPYKELNNIIIVDQIEITCNNKITIEIKEIIPIKEENTIQYKYKYYKNKGNNINENINKIEKEEKKTIYLNHHKLECNKK